MATKRGRHAGADRQELAPVHAMARRQLVSEPHDLVLDAPLIGVCGSGVNSPLETIWVGIGVSSVAVSAGERRAQVIVAQVAHRSSSRSGRGGNKAPVGQVTLN